ncbi:MAG TPA: FAD-dependent oxidoreductase, partial [Planctomycetota bacterium]|nr:FAD-dependent oxidoreductase [Planctomycetota bacterium]
MKDAVNGVPDFDLVSIGSGPAGQRAAVQAAKLGKRAAVIERFRKVGGVCLWTGTVPSKTFREAVLGSVRSARRGERPTIQQLLSRVDDVVRRETEVIESQLRRNDVTLIRGEASFHDPHTLVVKTERGSELVTADRFVIAVGTQPVPPPGVPTDGELVITSDDVPRLKRLPKSLVVVGGGVIGVEYASMFAALGVPVTVVEKREAPLEMLDREIVDELVHQMRSQNVTFRLGEAVQRVEILKGEPSRAAIRLESGKRIVADLVLFSAGRKGATAGLELEAAGLKADDRGRLAVDAEFRTTVPHIYAAGDVIGYPSLAATSSEQGRLAACHAFGASAGPMAQHFPIGIYAIPEISMVGATERDLTAAKVPYEHGVARYR